MSSQRVPAASFFPRTPNQCADKEAQQEEVYGATSAPGSGCAVVNGAAITTVR